MQDRYGVSDVVDSWGEKENLTAHDNLNDFFRTGLTSMTSVSVSYGNETLQTYFSYATSLNSQPIIYLKVCRKGKDNARTRFFTLYTVHY